MHNIERRMYYSSQSKLEEYKDEAAKRKEAESKAAENDKVISDLNRELEALRAKLAEAERCAPPTICVPCTFTPSYCCAFVCSRHLSYHRRRSRR